MHLLKGKGLQKTEHLHVLPLAGLAHAGFKQAAQVGVRLGQLPTGQRGGLIEGTDLPLQQGQIVDRLEDQVLSFVRAWVPGDDLGGAADDHLVHVATDPDLLVTVGDGHRVVVAPIAHQGERIDPRALLVAGLERRRRQFHQLLPVASEPLADGLAMAAQDVAFPSPTLMFQVSVEGVPARKPGDGNHEVPAGVTDQPLHLALIIALAGAAISILEQIMGLKPAERSRSLPRAVRQDARHQALVIVVENRLGNAAEEGEGPVVAVQPGLRRRRRVGATKQASLWGRSMAKKCARRLTPAMIASASPKSA